MYGFVDVIEAGSAESLPAEAVSINGTYIENVIPGYRTLYVTGRELTESEIKEIEIESVDGAEYLYKRNIQRNIVVTYQLLSGSPEEFRDKFNKLNQILNQEQAVLVFNDEPDKYFIGTKSEVRDIEGGRLNVVGEFTFYCLDPHKYASVQKEFSAALNEEGILEMKIVNNGSAPVSIDYEITHNHDNGFIGIVSENGAMQYGRDDEVDTEVRSKSEILADYKESDDFANMTLNNGIVQEPTTLQNGTFKTVEVSGIKYLALDDVGTGEKWHGASKTLILPADSQDETGWINFKVQTKVWFEAGKNTQTGTIKLIIGDTEGKELMDFSIYKSSTNTNDAIIHFGATMEKVHANFTADAKSPLNSAGGLIYLQKSGELFEFYFAGKTYQYREPSLSQKKAASVTILLGQYGTRGTSNLMSRLYFKELMFRADKVSYMYDIPNRYPAGSIVTIDGSNTKMYVDGVPSLGDEMVGTKYFKAEPGETSVQFFFSDFSVPRPTVKARIREAYL